MSIDLELKSKPLHQVIIPTVGLLKMQMSPGVLNDVAIPYWRGAPGIGKTAFCGKFITEYGMNVLETHFGQTPIEEVSGLPTFFDVTINNTLIKGTQWTLPEVLTQLYQVAADGKPTVWLLDDFHLAPPSMMALGFEMFTKHKLRGMPLPQNAAFLLAGNMSAKAGSKKNLLSAVANRCVIMPVHSDFTYWKSNFAIANGINSKVISFLSHSKYTTYFQEEEQLENPWASARSWTKFANLLSMMENYLPDVTMQDLLYYGSGHVGTEAASEFTTYYKIYAQVETSKIFDKQIPIVIPTDFAGQYIFMIANANEFINRYKNAKSDVRLELIETMSNIIMEMTLVKPPIAITGMKELIMFEESLGLRNIYVKIKSVIGTQSPEILSKITESINQL